MKRTAKAHWEGTIKEGKGNLSTQSGVIKSQNYSYKTRFEDDVKGTNPEELIAAAHAGCFTMAMSLHLGEKGYNPISLDTEASLTLEGTEIKGIHLNITGKVPDVSEEEFKTLANDAAKNCIVSIALKVPITSEAKLSS